MGIYRVLDAETGVHNKGDESVGKFNASPFHPDNHVVVLGWRDENCGSVTTNSRITGPGGWHCGHEIDLLVGHNIGFDLLYLYKDTTTVRKWVVDGGRIWDTMIAEYMLSGQDKMFPSLDYCSLKRGGTLKDEKIKEYWEAGMETEDIPQDELREYLVNDVINTEKVFLSQIQEAEDRGMLNIILVQMEARLATIEMEYNGMHFDKDKATTLQYVLEQELAAENLILSRAMGVSFPEGVEVKTSSPSQLSAYLFGGAIKHTEKQLVVDSSGIPVKYKTGVRKGEEKTKNTEVTTKVTGVIEDYRGYSSKTASGQWKTGDEVMKKLLIKLLKSNPYRETIVSIMKIRKLSKDVSSFYKAYSDLTWHDKCIHPNYNHTATATGRLSCSSPNLQQTSHKE